MIISLGVFLFNAPDVTGLKEKISPHFGTYRPIGGDPIYQDTNGSSETITIQGVYIADSNSKQEVIRGIARAKKPVRLTMASGRSAWVIVTNFTTDKKHFLPFGGAVNVDFKIELKKVGGEFGVSSIIGGILAAL